ASTAASLRFFNGVLLPVVSASAVLGDVNMCFSIEKGYGKRFCAHPATERAHGTRPASAGTHVGGTDGNRPAKRHALEPEASEAEEGRHIRRWMCDRRPLESGRRGDDDVDRIDSQDQRLRIRLVAEQGQLGDDRHVRRAELLAAGRHAIVSGTCARARDGVLARCHTKPAQIAGMTNPDQQREEPHAKREPGDGFTLPRV
ncbi:MAG: hypothetical protein ACM338_11680, partial [Betaproteobacteria bacterium]